MALPPIVLPPPVVVWEPQPGSQVAFLTCPYEEVLYEGTRGPGKTDALLMKFAQHVGEGYGEAWRGIIFRKTYKQLADVTAKSLKWFRRIFPFAKFNKSDYSWEFSTGETLLFRYMDNPLDYWNYHGHEYPFVGWEELTNWADAGCYDAMKSCNRSSHPDPTMPRFYGGTCNPFGAGHHWVKARFIDRAPPKKAITETFKHPLDGSTITMRRCYIHGSWRENKRLIDSDPLYIAKLMSITDENKRKAWLDGDWNITAGSILGSWYNSLVHCIEPFNIPTGWKIRRSFDWGSSKPFSVGWWATSNGEAVVHAIRRNPKTGYLEEQSRTWPAGTVFRIAEWYGCKKDQFGADIPNEGLEMLSEHIARGILDREREMRAGGLISSKVLPGPADASIYDTEDGHCIAVTMAKENGGTDMWTPADKGPGSRVNGWEKLRVMLSAAMDTDPNGNPIIRQKPMEKPGMFIFNTCTSWTRCVPALPRDPLKPDDADTKAEDHNGDETRYFIYNKAAEQSSQALKI